MFAAETLCESAEEFRNTSVVHVSPGDVKKHSNGESRIAVHLVRECLENLLTLKHGESRNQDGIAGLSKKLADNHTRIAAVSAFRLRACPHQFDLVGGALH
jgi:hypothetical protein